MLFVLVSIDWELDFAERNWNRLSGIPDYGGILVGTPFVTNMLDNLSVPCTWFVETHAEFPERDTPTIFPELVRAISERPRDELGVHIHWSTRNGDGAIAYPVDDERWVTKQLEQSRRTFGNMGLHPVVFRSGAFLGVPALPRLLEANGYTLDSSVLWSRSNTFDSVKSARSPLATIALLIRRNLGRIPSPYRCSHETSSFSGNSVVVEFPVHFNIMRLISPSYLLCHLPFFIRLVRMPQPAFLVLFFHIDELTDPRTGPDDQTKLATKENRATFNLLKRLQRMSGIQFLTFSQAREILGTRYI